MMADPYLRIIMQRYTNLSEASALEFTAHICKTIVDAINSGSKIIEFDPFYLKAPLTGAISDEEVSVIIDDLLSQDNPVVDQLVTLTALSLSRR